MTCATLIQSEPELTAGYATHSVRDGQRRLHKKHTQLLQIPRSPRSPRAASRQRLKKEVPSPLPPLITLYACRHPSVSSTLQISVLEQRQALAALRPQPPKLGARAQEWKARKAAAAVAERNGEGAQQRGAVWEQEHDGSRGEGGDRRAGARQL